MSKPHDSGNGFTEDARELVRLVRLLMNNIREVDMWVRIDGEPNYLGDSIDRLCDRIDTESVPERGGDFAAAQRDALAECYGEALELLASVLQNDEIQEGFNAANLGDLRDKIKNFLMCKPPHTRSSSDSTEPHRGGTPK